MGTGDKEKEGRVFRSSFEEAVWRAYENEHGVKKQVQIARLMGISSSALSQLFSGDRKFNQETIQKFLAPIASETRRQAILDAYSGETLERAVEDDEARPIAERVAWLAHENRPERALALAREALAGNGDGVPTWTLVLLAARLCFRLDLPDEAMAVAGFLNSWGEAAGEPEKVAAALAVSARAMRRTVLFTQKQAQAERARGTALLKGLAGLPKERVAVAAFARDLLESEDIQATLMVHEALHTEEESLRGHLARVAERRARSAHSPQGTFRARQLEASIHLGLGEIDKAERALDAAVEAGGRTRDTQRECGHLFGPLLDAKGEEERAVYVLRKTIEICEKDRYVYLARLAQAELARIERRRAGIA